MNQMCASRLSTEPTRVDCLAPLWEYKAGSIFPKDTTIHCPAQKSNREPTTLRLPACVLIHESVKPLVWMESVKGRDTTVRYAHYGYRTYNLTITIRRSNKLSYARKETVIY